MMFIGHGFGTSVCMPAEEKSRIESEELNRAGYF